jgi:hypothetical protein
MVCMMDLHPFIRTVPQPVVNSVLVVDFGPSLQGRVRLSCLLGSVPETSKGSGHFIMLGIS